MNNKKRSTFGRNKKTGFTLIELLVAIAIIGILATIILASLTESQSRGYDSKILQQLNGFRTAAQLYFSNHGGYGPDTNSCNDNTSIFKSVDPQDGSPSVYIDSANLPEFTQVYCSTDSSGRRYAVKATLYNANQYWCVDSTGASRKVTGTPTNGTVCP